MMRRIAEAFPSRRELLYDLFRRLEVIIFADAASSSALSATVRRALLNGTVPADILGVSAQEAPWYRDPDSLSSDEESEDKADISPVMDVSVMVRLDRWLAHVQVTSNGVRAMREEQSFRGSVGDHSPSRRRCVLVPRERAAGREETLEALPEGILDRLPHFTLVRLQRWHMLQVRDRIADSEERIVAFSKNPRAAMSTFRVATALTEGLLLRWIFSSWKLLNHEDKMVDRQIRLCQNSRPQQLGVLLKMLRIWCLVKNNHLYEQHGSEMQDRLTEAARLRHNARGLEAIGRELRSDVQYGAMQERVIAEKLKKSATLKLALKEQLEQMRPQALTGILGRALQLKFELAVPFAGLGRVRSKWALFGKDIMALAVDDRETTAQVSKLPIERTLVRWINYLLLDAKLSATSLLEANAAVAGAAAASGGAGPPAGGGSGGGGAGAPPSAGGGAGAAAAIADSKRTWTSQEAPKFAHWCRLARGVPLLKNTLSENVGDGGIWIVLCAMLKAVKQRGAGLDPSDLQFLDERDPEARAASACRFLHSFAPSKGARSVLEPADLVKCNGAALKLFLAAVFLADPPGLDRAPTDVVVEFDDNVESVDPAEEKEREETRQYFKNLKTGEEDPAKKLLESLEGCAGAIAHEAFQDPHWLLKPGEDLRTLQALPEQELLLRWLNQQLRAPVFLGASPSAGTPPTLTGTPPTTSAAQLGEARRRSMIEDKWVPIVVNNFGEDLTDGTVLARLLQRVAPGVMQAVGVADEDLSNQVGRIKAIMSCGSRCTGADVLTKEALLEGQEDVLTTFVGSLFISRPSMQPRVGSRLWAHLQLLEEVLDLGHRTLKRCAAPTRTDRPDKVVRAYCNLVSGRAAELHDAFQSISEAHEAMDKLTRRIHSLIGLLATKRALNQQVKPGFTDGPREQIHFTFQDCLRNQVWVECMAGEPVSAFGLYVRRNLRARTRFLAEVFSYYSVKAAGGAQVIRLDGLMRIYRDCHLNCPCVHLSAQHAEALFLQVLQDRTRAQDRSAAADQVGFSEVDFMRWLVRVAVHRDRAALRLGVKLGLRRSLMELLDHHLHAYSQRAVADDFELVLFDAGVRNLFAKREQLLRAIFEVYATQPAPEEEPLLLGPGATWLLDVAGFEAILRDGGVLSRRLTSEVVRSIYGHVMRRSVTSSPPTKAPAAYAAGGCSLAKVHEAAKEGRVRQASLPARLRQGHKGQDAPRATFLAVGEREGMRFHDFLEALVGIAMYHAPNLLTKPEKRLGSLLEVLLPALRSLVRTGSPLSRKPRRPARSAAAAQADARAAAESAERFAEGLEEGGVEAEPAEAAAAWERAAALARRRRICAQLRAVAQQHPELFGSPAGWKGAARARSAPPRLDEDLAARRPPKRLQPLGADLFASQMRRVHSLKAWSKRAKVAAARRASEEEALVLRSSKIA